MKRYLISHIDIDEELVEKARTHIATAGLDNVEVICSDGGLGCAAAGPYDKIILTVNATNSHDSDHVPAANEVVISKRWSKLAIDRHK